MARQTRLKTQDNKQAVQTRATDPAPQAPYYVQEQPAIAQHQVTFEETEASHVIQSIPWRSDT